MAPRGGELTPRSVLDMRRVDEPSPSAAVLRPVREHDADAVVSAYRAAWGDERPIDAGEIVSWIRNPELDPELMRVLERDGCVVGYGDIAVSDDVVAVEVAAPGCWDVFLTWAEETARAKGVPCVRVLLYNRSDAADVVAARGYRYWRSAYTMQIDFDADAPPDIESPPPPGIKLREYKESYFDALREALNEAFSADPFFEQATPARFREFYLNRRGFDPSLWVLAWDHDELVGFVLAFCEHLGDRTLGWIDSLGVRRAWRHRGIGQALLRTAFERLQGRGLRRAGLGVDAGNETNALRLYERAGMRAVRRADNWVLDV